MVNMSFMSLQNALKGFIILIDEKSHHSNAIFKLNVAVIALFLRKIASRQEIPFIAGMNKMNSVLIVYLSLPAFNLIDYFTGIVVIKRFQRIKAFAVFSSGTPGTGSV